jgi:membrane-associated PAP2 superfamily phosphatase
MYFLYSRLSYNSTTNKKIQMLKHWVMLTVVGFLTAGVVFAVSYYLYNRFFVSHRPWAMAVRKRFPMGLFRRLSSGNVTSKRRQSYELVRRDEEDAM